MLLLLNLVLNDGFVLGHWERNVQLWLVLSLRFKSANVLGLLVNRWILLKLLHVLIQVHVVVYLILGIDGLRRLMCHQIVVWLLNLNLLRLLALILIRIWLILWSINDLLLLISHNQPNLLSRLRLSWHIEHVTIGVLLVCLTCFTILDLIFLEDCEGVWKLEGRLLHLQVENTLVLSILRVVVCRLNSFDPRKSIHIVVLQVLDFRISYQSLFWLLTFLIKDTEVVPDFRLESVKWGSFDDIFKGVTIVTVLVVDNSEGGPIGCFSRVLESGFLQVFQGFFVVIEGHLASTLNVKSVSLERVQLLDIVDVFQSFVDFALLEAAPRHMKVNFIVGFICDSGSFILSHSLSEIFEVLVEHTHLDKCISLPFQSKCVRQDWVLEVTDSLLNLIGLGKYHSKLVKNLTLLVKVWWHLQNSDQSTNGMVIRLKLFI